VTPGRGSPAAKKARRRKSELKPCWLGRQDLPHRREASLMTGDREVPLPMITQPPIGFVRCREPGTLPRLASSRCRRGALSGAVAFVGHCRRGRLLTSLSTCSATSQHLSHGHTRGSAGETSGSRQTWRQREGRCWTHGRAAPTNASKSRAEVVMVEQERPSPASR
jgi:hypothetical protein